MATARQEPFYPGQVRRDLLITIDPRAAGLAPQQSPPGVWARVEVDWRDETTSPEEAEGIGRPTAKGNYAFVPLEQLQMMEVRGAGSFAFTAEDPETGVPLQEADVAELADRSLAEQRVTYSVSADIAPTADGSWVLHPNAAMDPGPHAVDGDVLGEQWKRYRWAEQGISGERYEREAGMTSGQILEAEQRAYELEAQAWRDVDRDLASEAAEPTRETLVADHAPDVLGRRQQGLLAAFAENTVEFERDQLEEWASAYDGWEGVSRDQFLAASSMYRFMLEHEGTAAPRTQEQERGKAKEGWSKRIPGLAAMREKVGQAVKYCTDPAYRKDVNDEISRPVREAASDFKEGFAESQVEQRREADARRAESAERREQRRAERAGRRDERRAFFGAIRARVGAEAVGLRDGVKARAKAVGDRVMDGVDAVRDRAGELAGRAVDGAARVKDGIAAKAGEARDAAVDAARQARDGVVGAAHTASAAAKGKLADGIDYLANRAPDDLRRSAEESRSKAGVVQRQAAERASAFEGGARTPEEIDALLDEAHAGERTGPETSGRRDFVVTIDRDRESGKQLHAHVQLNQQSELDAGRDMVADPRVAMAVDADPVALRVMGDRGLKGARVLRSEGPIDTIGFSVSAEVQLDERGLPKVDGLADLARTAENGPAISDRILLEQQGNSELVKDRAKKARIVQEQQEAVQEQPERPVIRPAGDAPEVGGSGQGSDFDLGR